MVTPSPNPAAFDGHWLRRGDMARLLGISGQHLDRLVRNGKLPPGSVAYPIGYVGRGRRRFDAGKVLAARQQERR